MIHSQARGRDRRPAAYRLTTAWAPSSRPRTGNAYHTVLGAAVATWVGGGKRALAVDVKPCHEADVSCLPCAVLLLDASH